MRGDSMTRRIELAMQNFPILVFFLMLLGACQTATTPAATSTGPTWYSAAKGVYARNCTTCHQPGGAGPLDFTAYATAKAALPTAIAQIEAGKMPPWMPDPTCRRYEDERILPPADLQTLKDWQANGAPEGLASEEPTAATATTTGPTGKADVELKMPAPYTPVSTANDDYRCFLLGDPLAQEQWMTASQVKPGADGLVHHVLIFLIFPEQATKLQELDDAVPGPGYTCYGGPGLNPTQTIAAWVPGATPQLAGTDTAVRLPKGARLVMQVHYNLQGHTPAPDQTSLQMWLRSTPPQFMVRAMPVANLGLHLAAGDAHATAEMTTTNNTVKPWKIVGAAGHMHRLGTEIKVTKLAAEGTETCLMDLPHWDFNWQQTYRFRAGEEVLVQPGESVKMSCTWDNSASNQSSVNGTLMTPKDVWWGESTADEMCLSYLSLVEPYVPYVPTSADACKTFDSCFSTCKSGLSLCIFQCATAAGKDCQRCAIQSLLFCTAEPPPGVEGCGPQVQSVINCLNGCQAKGPTGAAACVLTSCTDSLSAWDTCAKPVFATGACDAQQKACGISLKP